MNVSGFELHQRAESAFCHNGFCGAIIPLCFAGISPSEPKHGYHPYARSADPVWRHRVNTWRRDWLRRCSRSGRKRLPTVPDFLAAQLLPWWLQCKQCGQWRQLPPRTPIGATDSPLNPERFTCAAVAKRTTLVQSRPQDFLGSVQTHAWIHTCPNTQISLAKYGIDLVGLSADTVPGLSEPQDSSVPTSTTSLSEHFPCSPIDLQAWERVQFPQMTRFPTLYLALRNTILCLWLADPKHLLLSRHVRRHCIIRGLMRIVLCEQWIPRLIDEFTCRGLINVGACSVDQPWLFPSNPKHTSLSVRVIGCPSVTSAIATRQLANGLIARHRSIRPQSDLDLEALQPVVRVPCVRFQPVLVSKSDTTQSPTSMAELCVWWRDGSNVSEESKMEQAFDFGVPSGYPLRIGLEISNQFTAPASIQTTDEQPIPSIKPPLVLPAHLWSDRIHTGPFQLMDNLAKQVGLPLRPVSQHLLLHIVPEEEQSTEMDSPRPRLIPVPTSSAIRMGFHVEAVLDMVSQLTDPKADHDCGLLTDMDKAGKSVQDCWDLLDSDVRVRLDDLDKSLLERQLIEFYLAAVEYDLTEPLTTNTTPATVPRASPTARLDRLPLERHREFLVDSPAVHESAIALTDSNEAHIPDGTPCMRSFPAHLFAHLLADGLQSNVQDNIKYILVESLNEPCPTSPSVMGVVGPQDEGTHGAESTPRRPVDVELAVGATQLSYGAIDDTISRVPRLGTKLYTEAGAVEQVDWVVVDRPVDQLSFIFSDKPSSIESREAVVSEQTRLPIYLPTSLRPLLIDDAVKPEETTPHIDSNADFPDPARLITVTLIYSSAWWRSALHEFQSKLVQTAIEEGDLEDQSTLIDVFGFLPTRRDERGFCHIFRDIYPKLDGPSILQTQIFAAAADRLHVESDNELIDRVDQLLHKHLDKCDDATSTKPIGSHVTRTQYDVNPVKRLCVMDENSPIAEGSIQFKPSAWKTLIQHCYLLVPSLVASNDELGTVGSDRAASLLTTPGLDVLSTSVIRGLGIGQLALRCILTSDFGHTSNAIADESTGQSSSSLRRDSGDDCEMEDFSSFDGEDAAARAFSERARRLFKRRLTDDLDL